MATGTDALAIETLMLDGVKQLREDDPGVGFWRMCSGCAGTVNPRSNIFACDVGMGCRECGGLGVLWDDTDYDAMAIAVLTDAPIDARRSAPAASAAEEPNRALKRLLAELAQAEADYRAMHDLHGDDSKQAGRAWDLLRRAGDSARAAVRRTR